MYMLTRGLFLCLFLSCEASSETNTKIILKWAHQQFVTIVHTLFYFLQDMSPKMTIKQTIFHHRHRPSLGLFTLWWWRHNWMCNAGVDITTDLANRMRTGKAMYNSLYNDYIHSHIDVRSSKKWYISGYPERFKKYGGTPQQSRCIDCALLCFIWVDEYWSILCILLNVASPNVSITTLKNLGPLGTEHVATTKHKDDVKRRNSICSIDQYMARNSNNRMCSGLRPSEVCVNKKASWY